MTDTAQELAAGELEALLDQLPPSDPRLATARARQAAVWRGQEPDYLPLLIEGLGQPWDGPRFTLPEQVADPDKMLYTAVVNAPGTYPLHSDSVLCLRPQLGVGTLATVFGVEYELSARYASPWVTKPVPRERLAAMEPDDLDFEGSLVGTGCRLLEAFRARLQGRLDVFLPDTQGPFDVAHLARGHDLFTDLYDDPPFVHHLMELATHAYLESTRRLKAAAGEPLNSGHHGNVYMENGGVRICDDSGTQLSPPLLEEFVLPYAQRALEAFGGGWVHWCGYSRHMVDAYLQVPAARGLNVGHMRPCDPREMLPRLVAAGKFYLGGWPKAPGQSLEDYFTGLLSCLGGKRGLLLACGRDDTMPEIPAMMDLWHQLQDRLL